MNTKIRKPQVGHLFRINRLTTLSIIAIAMAFLVGLTTMKAHATTSITVNGDVNSC
jgi:hypothetical protein